MSVLENRLQEVRQLFRTVPWMLRLLWQSHRGAMSGLAVLTFLQALAPVAQLWITKLLTDQLVLLLRLPSAARTGEPVDRALMLVGLEAGILVVSVLLTLLAGHTRNVLQEHMVYTVQRRTWEQSARLDLAAYESPLYYDQLRRAQQQGGQESVQILAALLDMSQTALTLLSVGALVVLFKPWIALILVVTTLPSFWALIHFGWRRFILFDHRTPDGRRAAYLGAVLSSDHFAKEIRLWGITRYVLDKALVLQRRFRGENIALSRKQAVASAGGEVLSTAGYYASYLTVVLGVIAGRLTLGDLALYAGAFTRMQSTFDSLLTAVANVYQMQLFAQNLKIFLELEPTIKAPDPALPAPRLEQGLTVRDLAFTYPETERPVLEGISFTVKPGECVALVGVNGAGKTTLVKLLLRFYDPTGGAIEADGVDLRRLDPEDWRRRVGVVFQDYARYQLTMRENIGIGLIEEVEDRERIGQAARAAGVDEIVASLPQGLETQLGRHFEGGVELSLGQWQRVALARALLRDAPLLIMDEPTAAMDPQAEYELYQKLRELSHGRMTFLISHRFSTVRMADRILVLADGRILEEGTHDELLAKEGEYARLFKLQAESYQMAPAGAAAGDGDGVDPALPRLAAAS